MGERWFNVESIVDSRCHKKMREYRVRWSGYGPLGDTWEPERNLIADGAGNFIQRYYAMAALLFVLTSDVEPPKGKKRKRLLARSFDETDKRR
jgi:hypothetical protein